MYSASREWSQRHIEELIKKNAGGGSGIDNYKLIIIPGPPYIPVLSGYLGTNTTINSQIGNNYSIILVNDDSGNKLPPITFLPVVPVVPIKISSESIGSIKFYNTLVTNGYSGRFDCCYYADLDKMAIDNDCSIAYLKLCILEDDDHNSYIGYGYAGSANTRITSSYPRGKNVSLNFVKYVQNIKPATYARELGFVDCYKYGKDGLHFNCTPANKELPFDTSEIKSTKLEFPSGNSWTNYPLPNSIDYVVWSSYYTECNKNHIDKTKITIPNGYTLEGIKIFL